MNSTHKQSSLAVRWNGLPLWPQQKVCNKSRHFQSSFQTSVGIPSAYQHHIYSVINVYHLYYLCATVLLIMHNDMWRMLCRWKVTVWKLTGIKTHGNVTCGPRMHRARKQCECNIIYTWRTIWSLVWIKWNSLWKCRSIRGDYKSQLPQAQP